MSPCDVDVSPRRRFGRRVTLFLSLLLPAVAACKEAPPTPFARGQRIPMGTLGVRVTSVEMVSRSVIVGAPLLPIREGWDVIAISLRFEGGEDLEAGKTALGILASTRVEDRTGKDFDRYPVPLLREQYRALISGSVGSRNLSPRQYMRELENMSSRASVQRRMREWVTLFPVPPGTSGFRLIIENPQVKGDQPRLASVDLGR